jgi:hypothetical protein
VLGKFIGVAHEIEQRLPQPHLVRMQGSDRSVAMNRHLVGVPPEFKLGAP